MKWVLLAVAPLGWAACTGDLPQQSFIDKLRVLAVQAEPAEVAPGQAASLGALVVEPPSKPAQPSLLWLACQLPPGNLTPTPCGVGADASVPPSCAEQPGAPLCVLGAGGSVGYTPDRASLGADGTGEVLITLVAADGPGGAGGCLADLAQNGGHFSPDWYDHCVVAYKRLAVNGNAGFTPNRNPTLKWLSLKSKDGDAALLPTTFPVGAPAWSLGTTRAEDASETVNGNYEALTVSWYTTSGKIDGARSTFDPAGCASQSDCAEKPPSFDVATSWTPPTAAELASTAPDGTVTFWAVIRDDRGGVSWLTSTARPQ